MRIELHVPDTSIIIHLESLYFIVVSHFQQLVRILQIIHGGLDCPLMQHFLCAVPATAIQILTVIFVQLEVSGDGVKIFLDVR